MFVIDFRHPLPTMGFGSWVRGVTSEKAWGLEISDLCLSLFWSSDEKIFVWSLQDLLARLLLNFCCKKTWGKISWIFTQMRVLAIIIANGTIFSGLVSRRSDELCFRREKKRRKLDWTLKVDEESLLLPSREVTPKLIVPLRAGTWMEERYHTSCGHSG